MAKWRQDSKTGKLIPIEEWNEGVHGRNGTSAAVHGDIQSFVSPVDGSVISDRRQLREHNKRNNVTSAEDFSPEYYNREKQKREDFYQGKTSRKETFQRRQELHEIITRAERNG